MCLLMCSEWHTDGTFCPTPLLVYETNKVASINSFHTTPNTSLGIVQATPSKVQPSPTVHTKEALGKVFCLCAYFL